jgi:hypothetical protein
MGQASRRKKARKAKKWQLMEQVVCLLEQCLEPEARVERDVWLPNLRSAGRAKEPHERQFDAVIKRGPPERESIWVVEVQARARNVEQSDYDGWLTKLEQVGAAGLICVAEKGFPDSVIDDAKSMGSRVKLLTLSELEGQEWPINDLHRSVGFSKIKYNYKTAFYGLAAPPHVIKALQSTPIPRCEMRRTDTGAPVSIEWLMQRQSKQLRQTYAGTAESEIKDVKWRFISTPMLSIEMNYDSKWYPVDFIEFTVDLVFSKHRLPLTCSKYEQIDCGGILAYALTAGGIVDGKEIHARVILRPNPGGGYRYMSHEVTGLAENAQVAINFTPT